MLQYHVKSFSNRTVKALIRYKLCYSTQGFGDGFIIRFYLTLLISGQRCKKIHQIFSPSQPNTALLTELADSCLLVWFHRVLVQANSSPDLHSPANPKPHDTSPRELQVALRSEAEVHARLFVHVPGGSFRCTTARTVLLCVPIRQRFNLGPRSLPVCRAVHG